ncbi:MAG: AAA family ATPase [Anaerolineae bacterium]|nr:AAA family ATPase [Anaerolineae bacterium]
MPVDLVLQAQQFFQQHIQDEGLIAQVEATVAWLDFWEVRTPTLIAAWLIPILKAEWVNEQELLVLFGLRSVQTARIATKLIAFDNPTDSTRRLSIQSFYADIKRRLFVYAYADVEALLIVVADRLASVAQLDLMTVSQREEWAERNFKVYLPLLEMLGMWQDRTELGNISLQALYPIQYQHFAKQEQTIRKRQWPFYEQIKATLSSLLPDVEIQHHESTPLSMYLRSEKGKKQGLNNTETLRIDVLLSHEEECYRTLGLIHHCWKPALRYYLYPNDEHGKDARFYDYIADPRYNGYRCLITTVMIDQKLVEFRIRSHEMESINRYGVTAALLNPIEIKNVWWQNQTIREVMRPGNTDVIRTSSEIGVITPNGGVIYPLPVGSTLVDVAFRIHSVLGAYAKSFSVNGRQKRFDEEVHHRDLVEVEFDTHYPCLTPEWSDCARLPATKNAIKRFLKQQDRRPHKGRRLIEKVLERENSIYQMRFPVEKIDHILNRVAHDHELGHVDTLYLKVTDGAISPDEVVASMIEYELIGHIILANGDEVNTPIRIARTWLQEKEPEKFDRKTRVLPGVEIVGKYIGRDKERVLVVYRKDSRHAPTIDQAVLLKWRSAENSREAIEVLISAPAFSFVVSMILNAVSSVGKDDEQLRLNLHHFHSELKDNKYTIQFTVDAPSQESLHLLQSALRVIERGGYLTDFKIWQLFPGHKMLIAARLDKRQQNPYTLKQVGNQAVFYGRESEIRTIMEKIAQHEMIVLYGQKRIGKTSLLYQLAEQFLPQIGGVLPILFDVQSLSPFETRTFLLQLAETAYDKFQGRLWKLEDRRNLRLQKQDLQENPFIAFHQWAKRVERALQGTRLLFLIDEFTRAEEEFKKGALESHFFDGMQWLVSQAHLEFILCVHDHIILREDTRSKGLLQRGIPIRLDALDRVAAMRLIQQPSERFYKIPSEVIDQILDLTHCHPYFIQAICEKLITHLTFTEQTSVTMSDLDQVIQNLLIAGEHYFSHYRHRVSEFDWDILKVIAYITEEKRDGVTSDQIRDALKRYGYQLEGWSLPKSLGDLKQTGLIEASEHQQKALYRIPIGLFHQWLRRVVTHVSISQDLQREN